MEEKYCKSCKKRFKAYNKEQADYLMKQHELSKIHRKNNERSDLNARIK